MINRALDVALITLLDGDLVQQPEHLGVAYLAAELRKFGWTAEIFPISASNEAELTARIIGMNPRLVGFSLTTISFARATRLGQMIKEALGTGTHITAGGPLVTSLGASLLRNPSWSFLDSAVRGDGEEPIVNLLQALIGDGDLAGVPGLCRRTFADVICNPLGRPINDLGRYALPARDQIDFGPGMTARIASSRGCTSRCSFCNAPNAANTLSGKVWRGRTPQSVVDEMEAIYRGMKAQDFEFVDSTFEDPGGTPWAKQRIASIAELILERGLNITFGCCVQAQNWREADAWLIDLLKRAGLQRVLIGVESGSDEALKRWSKKATAADNLRAIGLFRSRSIYVNMGFIMFHPYSTRQEVMENAAFLRAAGCHTLRPFCTRLEVYPGTAVLEELREERLLRPEYERTLDPYAYRFVDADLQRLAYAMALLAGEEYADTGAVTTLPPHLQFGFLDVALHTKITRKMRSDAMAGLPTYRFRDFFFEYRAICEGIGAFNYELFQTIAALVLSGKSPQEAVGGLLDDVQFWYEKKMDEVSSLYGSCMEEEFPFAALNASLLSNSMAGVP
ncbi:MAG TPA: radical SAM protein [Candidatus Angelobacter sp.]|nr:radical SAM protein [Candidatus Angelobacter sp.]